MKSETTNTQTKKDIFTESWKKKKLHEICSIRRGASPRPIQNFIQSCGIPWVKISDATKQKTPFIEWTKECINENGKSHTVMVESGDLILSNSATPGLPKFMKINAAIHDGWLLFRNFNGVDKTFLYYFFINERLNLVGIADGTVFKNLKIDILLNHDIFLPPLYEQEKIGKILFNLDTEIVHLNTQNKTLENIIQSIFKSWFVDFDGQTEFVDSELGPIPKGWKVDKIGNVLQVKTGGTPSRQNDSYWFGDIPWIGSGKIRELRIINADENITELGKMKSPTIEVPARTTVLAIIGNTIGEVSVTEINCCINQNIAAVFGNQNIPTEYIYPCIKFKIIEIMSWKSGGAQASLNQNAINQTEILIPDSHTMKNYYITVKPIFDHIALNCFLNQNLTKIRDSLLPKLMSGEIRV